MKQSTTASTLPSKASAALLILLTIPSLTTAASLHNSLWSRPRIATPSPADIFGRASSCGDSSYVQCSADLPSDFCCPSGQTCISLAGKTTAICCPEGGNCAEIETIPCDISLEDKSQHPAAVVMTSALTGTLETCGDQCCPFGYSCNGNGNCDMNKDQSAKPSTSSVASSATVTASSGSATATVGVSPTSGTDSSPSATGTSSSSSSASAASAAADSTSTSSSGDSSPEASSSSGDSSAKAGVVAGGVIGGLAGAVLLGFLILFLVKRDRRRKELEKNRGEGGDESSPRSSFGNIIGSPVTKGGPPGSGTSSGTTTMRGYPISKPILAEDMVRSDFGRMKSPQTPLEPTGPRGVRPGGVSEYYGGAGDKSPEDDGGAGGGWDDAASSSGSDDDNDRVDGLHRNLHEVARSPPRITTPRAVSSMYASYYDPGRASEYQPPVLRMPAASAFGGDDRVPPVPSTYGNFDPFADYAGGSLAPPPLRSASGASRRGGEGGDRVTRFSDVLDEARRG